jgi:ribosome biogenesis GTPase
MQPDETPRPTEPFAGVVVRSTGSWYTVRPDAGGDHVEARVRGKFRLQAQEIDETNPVAVGDRVVVRPEPDGTGLITEILPRHNQLSRRAAGRKAGREHVIVANVDAAWVVQSTFLPKFNPGFVDRFLVMAEAYHLDAGIVINKVDLLEGEDEAREVLDFWTNLYRSLGYPVLWTSAKDGTGVDSFRQALAGRTSAIAGPSGVGKSSLLNAVDPTLEIRTGDISERTRKGKHTTTFATLHELSLPRTQSGGRGFVVDTPGLREFGIWDMTPQELAGYFVEMRPYIGHCRFPNCTHDHEPGCAVGEAVDAGEVSQERYAGYLAILGTLRETDVGR